jgi:hypothetical protein
MSDTRRLQSQYLNIYIYISNFMLVKSQILGLIGLHLLMEKNVSFSCIFNIEETLNCWLILSREDLRFFSNLSHGNFFRAETEDF